VSTLDELRELWRAAVMARHAAALAVANFDAAMAAEGARRCVPPGYAIDVLGDGSVKPEGEIARTFPE
jgi:hypothetical protein